MRKAWSKFVAWVERSVTRPEDSESLRIRKTVVVIVILFVALGNFAWTLALTRIGLQRPALISIAYGVVNLLAVFGWLFRSRNFTVFTHIVIGTTFVMHLALQTTMGGIVSSGLVILAGLLAAMATGLVLGLRAALFWAGVNVALFTYSLAIEEQVAARSPADFPAGFSIGNGFFNTLWVTLLATFLIIYLVRELEAAQDLADGLLFNVLPRPIADRLKRGAGTIARSYDSASVLFADIVGFTPLSTVLSPQEMIELLNRIYSHFDRLVEKHAVEKLRTIGDNYMAAAGVPEPRPDHARALADLALDMQAYCRELAPVAGRRLQFRIGINSGPLIAGVIGTARYQYDIWGDTVNTASRMESQGEPGKIQVTDATRALLGEGYVLAPRGTIEVKGKGEMRTWFLEGRVMARGNTDLPEKA